MRKIFIILLSILSFQSICLAQGSLIINWQLLDKEVRAGSETLLILTLINPGKSAIKTIELNISAPEYISLSDNYIKIEKLNPNSSQQIPIIIKVDPKAISKITYITIKTTYFLDSTQEETTINVPIIIKRIPIILIEDISYEPSLIEPGNFVQLKFNLKNYGDSSAKDIRVLLTQISNIFVAKTSEIFIREIQPGQKIPISFNLTINPRVEAGTYLIPISIYYLDETKTENYSSTKNIGLIISGKYNFLVTLESQDILLPGKKGFVTIKVINAGTQEAKFVSLKFLKSENFRIFPELVYMGNLKSDDYTTEKFEFEIGKEVKPGNYFLKIELSYKDLYGKDLKEEHEINIKVYSPSQISEKDFRLLTILLIVLVIISLIYFLYKAKAKK